MITGDHVMTACAIAAELGILTNSEQAITGDELSKLSTKELTSTIYDYSVFARVTPQHKVRIVKAFQDRGAIVAMTGDGVNDAPALKAADIGCAMGIGGTDVAKGAADMILTDDNFATIVAAVKEGRGIYSNILKSVHFLLSSNIGEILTIFIGILLGWPSPLLAIHLLWVNLVTDSLPAIALGLDPASEELMVQKPRDPKKSLFADGLWLKIAIEGCMIGALALLAFSIGRNRFDVTTEPLIGRTMAFAVLSISQLVHAFNMRSEHSLFSINLFGNVYLIAAFLVGCALQTSVILFKPLAKIFKVIALTPEQWLIVAILSLLPIVLVELQKWANSGDYDKLK
jgi:Ca2+-transporting ATPase